MSKLRRQTVLDRSNVATMPPARAAADHVDELIDQWRSQRPDLDLDPMATFGRLGRVMTHAGRSIEGVFARHGLNVGEFDVLAALRRAGDPFVMTPTDLSRLLMLSPGGMTNRLDRLEAAGHVSRRPDPDDRRSSLVVLTPAGRVVVDEAVADHVDNERQLLAVLSPTERTALDRALRRLLAQFE
jgi:DNA-binding MarR family transcriptional regulator